MKRAYRILGRLAEAFGPSAAEEEVAEEIRTLLGKKFSFMTTPHGNVVAWKKRRTKKRAGRVLMLQAHMDELGFRPFRYLPNGFIQVSPLSPLPDEVANHPIKFKPGDRMGLLLVRKEGPMKRYFLDVGARDAEEAQRSIPYYATGAYESRFGMSASEFTCKSFDDRAGCALIVELLLSAAERDDLQVVGVFTTREEFGSWPIPELVRHVARKDLIPDLLINLEVCPGGPTPNDPNPLIHVGKGVGLVHMDRFYASSAAICRFMVETAEAEGIAHQHVAMRDGGGELGTLSNTMGVEGYSLVLPGRYMHSPHSVISRVDYDAAGAMLKAIVKHF